MLKSLKKNTKIYVDDTLIGVPKIPSVEKNIKFEILSKSCPRCAKKSGIDCPKYAYAKNNAAMIVIGKPTARRAPSNTRMIASTPI